MQDVTITITLKMHNLSPLTKVELKNLLGDIVSDQLLSGEKIVSLLVEETFNA
jgi:hypothetical protein